MKGTPFCLALLCLALGAPSLSGQTLLDLGLGTSQQDRWASQLTLRRNFSPQFRAGLEVQFASPRNRFIEARPIDRGYAFHLALPLTYQIYQRETLQLFAFLKPSWRRQGIIDPDGNDQRDSLLRSTALAIEPGLFVNLLLGERLQAQSGVTFPTVFEIDPSQLFENQTTLIHAGLAYRSGARTQWFLNTNCGPAFGASGDSQKFLWSAQVGWRLALGTDLPTTIVEATF